MARASQSRDELLGRNPGDRATETPVFVRRKSTERLGREQTDHYRSVLIVPGSAPKGETRRGGPLLPRWSDAFVDRPASRPTLTARLIWPGKAPRGKVRQTAAGGRPYRARVLYEVSPAGRGVCVSARRSCRDNDNDTHHGCEQGPWL